MLYCGKNKWFVKNNLYPSVCAAPGKCCHNFVHLNIASSVVLIVWYNAFSHLIVSLAVVCLAVSTTVVTVTHSGFQWNCWLQKQFIFPQLQHIKKTHLQYISHHNNAPGLIETYLITHKMTQFRYLR